MPTRIDLETAGIVPTDGPLPPSAAALDLALHAHLRQGLVIETLGDLLDLAQAADLPRDLPMETITAGCLLARYCPAIAAMPGHPGSGYHAHLDLTGIDDADPDDADRPTVAEVLDEAYGLLHRAHKAARAAHLYLDVIMQGDQRYLVASDASDGNEWNVARPCGTSADEVTGLALACVTAWVDHHPGVPVTVVTDHAPYWTAVGDALPAPHRHLYLAQPMLPWIARHMASLLPTQEVAP